jgi:hypothetical protein
VAPIAVELLEFWGSYFGLVVQWKSGLPFTVAIFHSFIAILLLLIAVVVGPILMNLAQLTNGLKNSIEVLNEMIKCKEKFIFFMYNVTRSNVNIYVTFHEW